MIPWDEYRYVAYAERYQWTPDQVDMLPATVEPWILPIAATLDKVERAKQEAEMRKQGG